MKMAKAPREEWESCMKFVHELEAEIKWPEKSDEELRAWISAAPCLFRVVFGYQVLVDNCADPASNYLDFKPEIKAAIESNTDDDTKTGRGQSPINPST